MWLNLFYRVQTFQLLARRTYWHNHTFFVCLLFIAASAIFQLYCGCHFLLRNIRILTLSELEFWPVYSHQTIHQRSFTCRRGGSPPTRDLRLNVSSERHVALLLYAERLAKSSYYHFYSLRYDPAGARTRDLPHARRTLYHWAIAVVICKVSTQNIGTEWHGCGYAKKKIQCYNKAK